MPFITPTTEYSFDVERAILASEVNQALIDILRIDISEWFYRATIEWILKVKPDLHYFVGTPMNLGRISLRQWRKGLDLIRDMDSLIHPRGRAHWLHSNDPPGRIMNSLLQEGLLWTVPRRYRTLVGQLEDKWISGDRPGLLLSYVYATINSWLPETMRPDQLEARDYSEECLKLQASPAGRKAKRLLIDNLSEAQASDYFRKGYFYVVPPSGDREPRLYIIERGFPNGNILRVKSRRSRGGRWLPYAEETYCFHAAEPHPLDDIILSQKLVIENDEEEFLEKANPSPPVNQALPLRFSLRGV